MLRTWHTSNPVLRLLIHLQSLKPGQLWQISVQRLRLHHVCANSALCMKRYGLNIIHRNQTSRFKYIQLSAKNSQIKKLQKLLDWHGRKSESFLKPFEKIHLPSHLSILIGLTGYWRQSWGWRSTGNGNWCYSWNFHVDTAYLSPTEDNPRWTCRTPQSDFAGSQK